MKITNKMTIEYRLITDEFTYQYIYKSSTIVELFYKLSIKSFTTPKIID